jgi:adenylate cyclase
VAFLRFKFDWRMLLLLPVPVLWALADHHGKLLGLENLLLSLRYHYRGDIAAPVAVHYVDVDTRAIQVIGERPWNRARFAEAAQLLIEQGGAKAVGFDFVFSNLGRSELVSPDESRKGNLTLAKLCRKYPQIVLAAQYTGGDAVTIKGQRQFPLLRLGFTDRARNDVPELPEYPMVNPASSATIGLIDIDFESGGDEVPRWAALFAESNGPTFWHFSIQLACIELGLPPGSARRAGEFVELVAPDGRVVRRIPVRHGQLLEANWFSEWASPLNPRTSLADVLIAGQMLGSGDDASVKQASDYFKRFAGAIVLIGPTDPLLQDLATTPLDNYPVPKVGVHGNLVKTIISEKYIKRVSLPMMWAIVIGLTFAVTGLTISGGARSLFAKVLALLLLIGFVVVGFHLFAEQHLVLPMAAPVMAAFSTGFMATIIQLVDEERQKGRIKGMFSAYLAPTVVNTLIDSGKEPELGGHEEHITAYFSDIQSFSTFSEKMTPARLVELMNEYLTACTDIVQEEGGTLDKYIGDAVVAIFGAPLPLPDHAYRACLATIRVQKGIEELRQKWRSEGDRWPPVVHNLRARLGLNTGPAIIGNMGSRTRFSYTMMGDNVNLAARMESGAKLMGVYTMVTDSTRAECEKFGGDKVLFRFLDKIVVKGRTLPVGVHEIVGLRTEASADTLECLDLHAQAIARYHAQDWTGAIALLERSAKLEIFQPDKARAIESNPSLIMIQRCRYMQDHPPGANWDGVFVMKEKG